MGTSESIGCALCDHRKVDGSWGTSEHHCQDCHRTWTGTAQAHCVVCHRHFTADSNAVKHRNAAGACVDPETVTNRRGERMLYAVESKYGVMWGGPPREGVAETLHMGSESDEGADHA